MLVLSEDAVAAIRGLCAEWFGSGVGGIRPVAIAPPPDQRPAFPSSVGRDRDQASDPRTVGDQAAGGRDGRRGVGRLAAVPVARPAPGDTVTERDGAACYLDPAMTAALAHRTLLGPVGDPDRQGTVSFALTGP